MTAKIYYLPVRRRPSRPPRPVLTEGERFDAAVEWLLREISEPVSLVSLRALAMRELVRPRDALHRAWATLFLEETARYW